MELYSLFKYTVGNQRLSIHVENSKDEYNSPPFTDFTICLSIEIIKQLHFNYPTTTLQRIGKSYRVEYYTL